MANSSPTSATSWHPKSNRRRRSRHSEHDTALLYGGYRYLNVDYDRSYVFDVEIQGIMLGLDFRF